MSKEEGLLEKRLDAQTYRHGFSRVGDIDVMMRNDSFTEDKVRREVDIVKMKTVKQILDEMFEEFPIKFTWKVHTETNGTEVVEIQVMPNAKLPENRANAHVDKDEVIDWLLRWRGKT